MKLWKKKETITRKPEKSIQIVDKTGKAKSDIIPVQKSLNCLYCQKEIKIFNNVRSFTDGRIIHDDCFKSIISMDKELLEQIQSERKKSDIIQEKINKYNKAAAENETVVIKLLNIFKSKEALEDKPFPTLIRKTQFELNDVMNKIRSMQRPLNDLQAKKQVILDDLYDYWPDYPPDWEKRRAFALVIQKNCSRCKNWLKEKLHVHHKVPLGKGGSNKQDNLEVLCETCHGKIHHTDFSQYGRMGNEEKTVSKVGIKKIEIIQTAILEKKDIEISYEDYHGSLTKRKIKPIEIIKGGKIEGGLKTNKNSTYVKAYCYLRKAERDFNLRNIRNIEIAE